MKKKIGILTQPLHDNYGGLLQAYALKSTLEKLDFNVEIVNRRKPYHSLKYRIANLLNRIRGKKTSYSLSISEKSIISKNTRYFAETYIKDITAPIYTSGQLKSIKNNYDAFVVGSDQVWKPAYSPDIANYYLDFVTNNKVAGLAYAASFGGDTWDYSPEQTATCLAHVHKFKAISVREESGVNLCKNNLRVEAVHVLDPTMLLKKEHYITLINNEKEKINSEHVLMHYVLDMENPKQQLIDKLADALKLTPVSVTQKKKVTKENVHSNIEDCIYPTVTSWLNGFHQSEFVITDSFHGTVFAILFNKPFLVFGNPGRGNARFTSLLKMFGLEERFVLDASKVTVNDIQNMDEIDWNKVNGILESKRDLSFNFLKNNLVI